MREGSGSVPWNVRTLAGTCATHHPTSEGMAGAREADEDRVDYWYPIDKLVRAEMRGSVNVKSGQRGCARVLAMACESVGVEVRVDVRNRVDDFVKKNVLGLRVCAGSPLTARLAFHL